MRTLVILNPAAGGRADARDLCRRIGRSIQGDLVTTAESGDAVGLAAEASRSGYGAVVAVGGDGTVREVATGLHLGGGVPRLGIVPAGTGNDLARSLGLPTDIEQAAAVAVTGRAVALDLIRVTRAGEDEKPFFVANVAVAGFCGRIGDGMNPALRRTLRPIAYPLAALGQIRDLRPYSVRLDVDGSSIETKALMVVLANSEYAGGRVRLAPGAATDDGRLDLVIIHSVSLPRLVTLVPRVLSGRHAGHRGVSMLRAATVRIESEPPMWINLDGDTWQAGPASFQVIPAALTVAVP
jgi:diacylglycerol kinase (ATP)